MNPQHAPTRTPAPADGGSAGLPHSPTAPARTLNPVLPAVEVVIARPDPARVTSPGLVHPGPPHLPRAAPRPAMATVGVDVAPTALPAPVHTERVGVPGQLGHRVTVERHPDTPSMCTLSGKRAAKVLGMARAKIPNMGRPSLGPRDNFNIRVPEAIGDLVRDLAEERGLSFNEVISEALGEHFGVPVPLPRSRRQPEQLPLSA